MQLLDVQSVVELAEHNPKGNQAYRADLGKSATRRNETEISSSWKWGLKYATAR
jgi:hypothetical protein